MAPVNKSATNLATAKRTLHASDAQGSIFDLSYGSAGKGMLTQHGRPAPASMPTRKQPPLIAASPKEDRLSMWGTLLS